MFAYCLNNPVALDDATGGYPRVSICVATFDHQGGGGEYEGEVIEENESQNKILAVAESLYNNVELSGDLGKVYTWDVLKEIF